LHSQAVIRSKLAAMMAKVESLQNWLENITYQMNNMVRLLSFLENLSTLEKYSFIIHFWQSYKQQASKLAG
jgi:hypothetical protein